MKKIAILGAAESGVGAAILAQKKGYDVFVSDMGMIKDRYKDMLNNYGIEWEEGQHTATKILDAEEIIKSPGIPDNAPIVTQAIQHGIHIINEIEFAGRYTNAKMICITGSNGKTTTTSLIYHILKNANYNVGLAGNIGRSLALQIAEGCTFDHYVVELSSFQLDNMYDFHANIAVLLNITPDHLDRYDNDMQKYADSKMRIIQNQQENDSFIYWADDPIIKRELEKYGIKAQKCPFSIVSKKGMIGYIENGTYTLETPTPFNMEQESLSLNGKHNMYNSLAAGIATRIAGVSDKKLKESLSSFEGVEHRLEKVATVGGVLYINDSKATNVDACWYALESMTRPTILIIGGKDKGNDYSSLLPLAKEKVKAMICMGLDNSKFHASFEGVVPEIHDVTSAKDAVELAHKLAAAGDVVLLSPCCASFDLFKNYEDRGRQFKEAVRKL